MRAEPRQDLGSAPTPEGSTPLYRTIVADRSIQPGHERRGVVEIRWQADGDPDDVVAPWPRSKDGTPITVHVERMDDGDVWMNIHGPDTDVHMWFHASKKNVLEWTVRNSEPAPQPPLARDPEWPGLPEEC